MTTKFLFEEYASFLVFIRQAFNLVEFEPVKQLHALYKRNLDLFFFFVDVN